MFYCNAFLTEDVRKWGGGWRYRSMNGDDVIAPPVAWQLSRMTSDLWRHCLALCSSTAALSPSDVGYWTLHVIIPFVPRCFPYRRSRLRRVNDGNSSNTRRVINKSAQLCFNFHPSEVCLFNYNACRKHDLPWNKLLGTKALRLCNVVYTSKWSCIYDFH